MTGKIYIKAPAKVNWYLRILGRRPDGYHDLESLMIPVDLFDEVSLTPIAEGVVLDCPALPDVPPEQNLAWRAAQAYLEACRPAGGVRSGIKKNIPAGGGLGGGSSDAAAVLTGMDRLSSGLTSFRDLVQVANSLGSDVPFFLYRQPAIVFGRGDRIRPLEGLVPSFWTVLVHPGFGVPTAWAYAEWDRRNPGLTGGGESATKRPPLEAVNAAAGGLYNGFEDLVFEAHPVLRRIKTAILDAGADGALLSGSGSTVFGVFPGRKAAAAAAARIARAGEGWQVHVAQGLVGAFD